MHCSLLGFFGVRLRQSDHYIAEIMTNGTCWWVDTFMSLELTTLVYDFGV
jgi:hypothetical protein